VTVEGLIYGNVAKLPPVALTSRALFPDRRISRYGRAECEMAESVKMTLPDGKVVDGVNVVVKESTERWSEFELDDGTKFRVKVTITGGSRALKERDPSGIPWYQLNIVPVFGPMELPEKLKKKG
jgi:hypothetical protein